MKESDIQRQILAYLKYDRRVALYWRQNTGATTFSKGGKEYFVRFGTPGISDILGVLHGGRFFAIEVKMPKRRLTESQTNFINNVNRAGGIAFVATCVEDVQEHLCKGTGIDPWQDDDTGVLQFPSLEDNHD
ncbi:MAG: VRR-NUC domain-containing protein [Candidatus Brocadiales bacterium]|nr:VRR-NUC domain-containing protein [Candidatus Bathyanammoxibius sp.]